MPLHAAQRPVTAVSANYTSTATFGEVMTVTGTHTVTLPTPSATNQGCVYTVKNVGTGTVTANTVAGTIDGGSSFTITVQYSSVDFINDGTNWFTV